MVQSTSTGLSSLPPPPPYAPSDPSAPPTASSYINPRTHSRHDVKEEVEQSMRVSGVPESDRQRIAAWVDGEVERILNWAGAEKCQRIRQARENWGDEESDQALVRMEREMEAGLERVEKERRAALERAKRT